MNFMVIKSPEKDWVSVYAPDSSWTYFADIHGNQIMKVTFLNLIMNLRSIHFHLKMPDVMTTYYT